MEAVTPNGICVVTDQAVARVKAYLACLGLPPDRAETRAKDLLEQCAAQPGVAEEDLGALALADVASRFNAWLDHLCESADEDAVGRKALLAWFLRPILAEYPDVFLRRGDLPEPVRLALQAAEQPPVPNEAPAAMPAQSFGEAPVVFRASFWRRLAGTLRAVKREMGAWIRKASRHAGT